MLNVPSIGRSSKLFFWGINYDVATNVKKSQAHLAAARQKNEIESISNRVML